MLMRRLADLLDLEGALVTGQIFAGATGVLVARIGGPHERGILTTAAVWIQLLGWLSVFSGDKIVITRGGNADHLQLVRRFRGLVWASSPLLVVGATTVVLNASGNVVLAVAIVSGAISTGLFELRTADTLASEGKRTYGRLRVMQPALYLLLVVLVLLASSAVAFSIGTASSLCIGFSFWLALSASRRGDGHPLAPKSLPSKEEMLLAARIHSGSTLQFLNARLDLVVLSVLVSASLVGQYAVAATVGQLLVIVGGGALARGLVGEAPGASPRYVLTILGVALVAVVASPFIIPLVFGSPFEPAVRPAQILAIGGFMGAWLQSLVGTSLRKGDTLTPALAHGSATIAFAVGLWVADGDLVGTAIAGMVAYLVGLIVALLRLRRTVMQAQNPRI